MANSRFEYVRDYEPANDSKLLPNCYIVVRVDGQRFHHFSSSHKFHKPNDKRALDLMVESGKHVIKSFYPNITMAYGQSDEFSFIFARNSNSYKRRQNKLSSLIVSSFTSAYVFFWSKYFSTPLLYPPSFDSRCVLYPDKKILVDYLKWRQVDCHINNLYNTSFYLLTGEYVKYSLDSQGKTIVSSLKTDQQPLTHQEAQARLKGTFSKDKHDIMFLNYNVNYNNELEQFKKGSLLKIDEKPVIKEKKSQIDPASIAVSCLNIDVIKEDFWEKNAYLLE
ncbi:tRNA-histidine guanylyltransferase [Brevipalpus obovatus]|uniref:tRNA-histidine guanylyltransferase n=1 Tax=Brevipalpus obovatus TaxID=246614 RepID=UPI003D9E1F2F